MTMIKTDEPGFPRSLQPTEDDSWPPRAANDIMWGLKRSAHKWRPPTDVFETEHDYRVVVEIAGMRGTEISVTFEGQTLAIRGERHESDPHRAYHQMEIAFGEFESAVHIPQSVKADEIQASYVDGFLRVTLPKSKPTQVEIG